MKLHPFYIIQYYAASWRNDISITISPSRLNLAVMSSKVPMPMSNHHIQQIRRRNCRTSRTSVDCIKLGILFQTSNEFELDPLPAIFYRLLHQLDSKLCQRLHQTTLPAPFCASWHTERPGYCSLRISSIYPPLSRLLMNVPNQITALDGIDYHEQAILPVYAAINDQCRYEDLFCTSTLTDPIRQIDCRMSSPCSLVSAWPTFSAIFNSLWNRWNTYAPSTLSIEIKELTEQNVEVSSAKLKIIRRNIDKNDGGAFQFGWTGYQVIWLTEVPSAQVDSAIRTLCQFSRYSGIGRKTAFGFGRVELQVLPDRSDSAKYGSRVDHV